MNPTCDISASVDSQINQIINRIWHINICNFQQRINWQQFYVLYRNESNAWPNQFQMIVAWILSLVSKNQKINKTRKSADTKSRLYIGHETCGNDTGFFRRANYWWQYFVVCVFFLLPNTCTQFQFVVDFFVQYLQHTFCFQEENTTTINTN